MTGGLVEVIAGGARSIDAVIFDLDGLLIDSEPLWWESEIEVFAGVGLRLDADECARTTGLRIDEVVELRFAEAPWPAALGSRPEVSARIIAAVIARIRERGMALPGAVEAVEAARARGLRVGLASSSSLPIIAAAVERLGLAGHFEVVRSTDGLPLGKPHPAVYVEAADALGVVPTRCLAIEDSLNGVLAAKAARMRCLAVPDGPHRGDPRYVIADRVLGSLAALDETTWSLLLR